MIPARSFAARDARTPLGLHDIDRRDPGPTDVQIEILFCGVCHSDLHTARSEWSGTIYPCVPGHEIVGRVTRVGGRVTAFAEGDVAAVGCMVDSCRRCPACASGVEQLCENKDITFTYNSPDKHRPGLVTYGGYSTSIVVDEHFCLRVSPSADLARVAPLLCAGITTYSPLRHWGVTTGKTVGIVGLGGLGHMGVKFAHAFGAHTVVFTTSPGKVDDAQRLGADEVVMSRNDDEMARQRDRFDVILDTVSASHDLDAFTKLLRRDGALVLVGVPEVRHPAPDVGPLIMRRRQVAGSLIGGIPETQEMLDFCAERQIGADIELIAMQQINEAYERMLRSDVKYRFVIDMASLRG